MSRQDTTESIRMAFATLHAHKFRSFLTVLGVVIGTVTVMVIASFISGLDQSFKQQIESFGTNTVFIYKFDPGIHTGRLTPEERMRKPISYEDAMAIKEQCPSVKYVAPFLSPDDLQKVRYQEQELYVTPLQRTTTDYQRTSSLHIAQGPFFTDSANHHRAAVRGIG